MSRTARERLATGLFALGFAAGSMATQPDFTGVWLARTVVTEARTADGKAPPELPATREQHQKNRAAIAQGDADVDGTLRCLPPGVPRLMFEAGPFEIAQRTDQLVLMFQTQRLVRFVRLNGKHPAEFVLAPYLGDSVGHWEGSTLVIDTVGLNDSTLIDSTGLPHSDALHVTERLRLMPGGMRLEDTLTIEDAATFSAPWRIQRVFEKRTDLAIQEDICLDRLHRQTSAD